MKFILGSKSAKKVTSLGKVVAEVLKSDDFDIDGCEVESGVPSTPREDQTVDGAINRARNAKHECPNADYWIGIESGLMTRFNHVFEEAWCCVIDKEGNEFLGYSSGLKVPKYILQRMENENLEHFELYDLMGEESGLDVKETWGSYTGGQIIREVSLAEAARNALIQIFAPKHGFYHK